MIERPQLFGGDRPRLEAGTATPLALHFFVAQFNEALAFAIRAFRFFLARLCHDDDLLGVPMI
jgi:hypothetical protein